VTPRPFRVELSPEAKSTKDDLEVTNPKRFRKVLKTLALLETNHHHPSLNIHKFKSKKGPNGEQVWVAYVENNVPAAYRLLWCHLQGRAGTIFVIAVTTHP